MPDVDDAALLDPVPKDTDEEVDTVLRGVDVEPIDDVLL